MFSKILLKWGIIHSQKYNQHASLKYLEECAFK